MVRSIGGPCWLHIMGVGVGRAGRSCERPDATVIGPPRTPAPYVRPLGARRCHMVAHREATALDRWDRPGLANRSDRAGDAATWGWGLRVAPHERAERQHRVDN